MSHNRKLRRMLAEQTQRPPVYGGCEDCDADQVLTEDPEYAGIFHLTVRHEDRCPFWRRYSGGAA